MPQPLKILLQRCNELNKRDDMVRLQYGCQKFPHFVE
jgi:hypothetical protein